MIAPPHPDCWLHPDAEVRRSPISGRGLFATAPIMAGTVVSRLGGRLVSTSALRELLTTAARDPGRPYIDTITVDADLHLVLPPRRPNGYGNHSCDPNLWWVSAYELAASRDIATGEELTNDYATFSGEPGTITASARVHRARRPHRVFGADCPVPAAIAPAPPGLVQPA
jgi:hypothetical protein